jgi:uncharacterized protein YegL
MPKLTDLETTPSVGNYGFSAVRPTDLGASEYTLCVLAADNSSSVYPFGAQIEQMVKTVVGTCRQSPRADNLLLRYLTFDSAMKERHGFKPLPDCAEADYTGTITPMGTTALNDTVFNAVESLGAYGKRLTDADFAVNGIVFVVTDGEDVGSTMTAQSIRDAVAALRRSEALESVMLILIGVNVTSNSLNTYLTKFKNDAGFDQYVSLPDADVKTLGRLAQFISKSISSQSQALGSGGPSQALVF